MCRSVNDWTESSNTDVRNLNSRPCLSPVRRVALCKHDSFQYASVVSLSKKVNDTGLHFLTASRKMLRAAWVVQHLFTSAAGERGELSGGRCLNAGSSLCCRTVIPLYPCFPLRSVCAPLLPREDWAVEPLSAALPGAPRCCGRELCLCSVRHAQRQEMWRVLKASDAERLRSVSHVQHLQLHGAWLLTKSLFRLYLRPWQKGHYRFLYSLDVMHEEAHKHLNYAFI